jgi:two-component system alkaline phosphatase synthesis response regulator PhoP
VNPIPFASALLVEDELNLARALEIALKKLQIPANRATTINEARQFLQAHPDTDLLLLDRALPDGDGLSLCKELRENQFTGSILMLTAFGESSDRVLGLNAGADDYLPKPFSWEELEARIRAISRRRVPPVPMPFGLPRQWDLDPKRLRIQGRNGWVELTPLEYKLAKRLIDAAGTIVTRDELLKDVWGFTLLPKTRTVDHFLGRLRKYLEQNPDQPQHFKTVRSMGYMFEP